jgi:hypothetical protein
MSQKVSKEKAINTIRESQTLEVSLVEVDRNESASIKRQKIAAYLKIVDEYLKSERDLVLVAVKVK